MGPYARKFKNSRRTERATLAALSLAALVVWATSVGATLHLIP